MTRAEEVVLSILKRGPRAYSRKELGHAAMISDSQVLATLRNLIDAGHPIVSVEGGGYRYATREQMS